jgi:hypothetical protein
MATVYQLKPIAFDRRGNILHCDVTDNYDTYGYVIVGTAGEALRFLRGTAGERPATRSCGDNHKPSRAYLTVAYHYTGDGHRRVRPMFWTLSEDGVIREVWSVTRKIMVFGRGTSENRPDWTELRGAELDARRTALAADEADSAVPENEATAEEIHMTAADDIKALAKNTDRQIADLSQQHATADATRAAAVDRAHYVVGDRKMYRGRRAGWGMDETEVIDRLKSLTGIALRDVDKAPEILGRIAADRAMSELDTRIAELDDIHREHRWARFFLVPGGHIHSAQYCAGGSIRPTTVVGWLPNLSGETEADAVQEHGAILCTHCFPTAPVEWTRGLDKPDEPEDPNQCTSQNIVPGTAGRLRVQCADCGARVAVTSTGRMRKHQRPNAS